MKIYHQALQELHACANPKKALTQKTFFKHCKNDTFLGVPVPTIRLIAKKFFLLEFAAIKKLMHSNVHEERSLAHAILVLRFKKSDLPAQEKIYLFYLKNRKGIKDWNGVDDSAPYIVGAYLFTQNKKPLYELVKSSHLWDRRIAIVATWYFIRQNHLTDTLKLAKLLLKDKEDLIHKATGWMLREVGKKDVAILEKFLTDHLPNIPRTTLRYAIERFPEKKRKQYLLAK